MAENIAKYGISLEFDKALKSLKKFKAEANKINKMQATMNAQRRNAKKSMLKQESGDLKSYYKDLERQSEKAYKADQKRLAQRRKQGVLGAVGGITAPTGAGSMKDHYKKLEQESAKSLKAQRTKQSTMEQSARRRQAVGDITASTGAEGMRSFYKDLEKDAKSLRREQEKLGDSIVKDMKEARRQQEKLGDAMNKDVKENIKLQKQRVDQLNRAKEAVSLTALMQDQSNNKAVKAVQLSIKDRVSRARTAKEVKRIVAQERARLKIMKKQSFWAQRMSSSSKQFAGNMVSAFAVAATGAFITKTGQDFEAVSNTMLAVSKDSQQAGENLEFVRKEAYRLGLGLKESAKGFAKMNAARGDMSLEDTKKAFTGIAEMSTLLGLSSEEGSRAINALQQMMSKGVVSAEELSH